MPPPLRPDQRVTITFENYNLASAGIGREATLKMIDEFQQQHPNITVEPKATSDTQMFSTIQAEVVAGTQPDLAQVLLREWDQNVESLPLQTLTDIVPSDELQAHLAGLNPMHPRALKLTERRGKLQGLPYVFSTPTLFYNADLFAAAGLDPNTPPRTWDEVRTAAGAIKSRTGNDGLYIACVENDWCAQGVLLSNGGRVMTDDRTQIQWSEPASLEVYRFWQGMVQEGSHAKLAAEDAQQAFQAGKLGMLLNTSAVQGALLKSAAGKFTVRAAGVPAFGARPPVPTNSDSALAILATDPALARLQWLNTLAALVVPQLAAAFAIMLMRQHLLSFPRELFDAANIDGASSWRTLWGVVVPNLRAPLAALAILLFVSTWKEYFWPLLVTSKPDQSVVQVGIQMFATQEGDLWGPMMAASTLACLPIFALYLFLQRQVVDAFVRSGLK